MSNLNSPLIRAIASTLVLIVIIVWLASCAQTAAPKLVAWKPGAVDNVSLDATLELSFDQPMDAESIAAAFHITPMVKGRFVAAYPQSSAPAQSLLRVGWRSPLPTVAAGSIATVFSFRPDRPLEKAMVYRLSLDTSAFASSGQPLKQPFTALFTTTGQLQAQFYPPSGASDVPTNTHISLSFNAPFSPTSLLQLEFGSMGGGSVRWPSDRRFEFQPFKLEPATRYSLSLPAGLVAPSGEKLLHDVVTVFTTTLPAVANHAPVGSLVRPSTSITLTFNLPMDKLSAQARFAVYGPGGNFIPGLFEWPSPSRLVFTPHSALSDGTSYSVTVKSGIKTVLGDAPSNRNFTYSFSVAPLPKIVSSRPDDGDMKTKTRDRVSLKFNAPMDATSVEKAVQILPAPATAPRFEWAKNGMALDIVFEIDPSVLYTIVLSDDARDLIGRPLQGNRSIAFRAAPQEPSVWLVGPRGYWNNVYGTYNPNPQVRQYTQFRNVDQLTYRLSSVRREDFLAAFRPDWHGNNKKPASTLMHTWVQTVTAPINKLAFAATQVTLPDGNPLPSGVYLLEVEGYPGKTTDWRILIVSPLNLTLKRSDKQTFIWATDLRTGQAVAGLPLAVYDMDKKLITQGRTNEVGVLKTAEAEECLDAWECAYGWRPLYVVAESSPPLAGGTKGGEGEDLWGFVASTWDEGIATRDFRMPYYYGEPSHTVFLYTDRPIYRPGQKVYFKGVARQDNDGRYSLPAFGRLNVIIDDAQGNEIYREELPLTDIGTFYGELGLDAEAALGSYTIQVQYAEGELSSYGNFRVAEYRKPEFKVSVTPSNPTPVHGETVTVTVQADYYFGAPLPNATVEWRLQGDDYSFWLPNEWYSFGDQDDYYWLWGQDYSNGNNLYANGTGKTNASGAFTFTVPLDLSKAGRGQVLSFEADVIDQNNQVTSSRGYAVAHKGKLYVGLRPRWYVAQPKELLEIQLVAADPDKQLLPNVPLTVELYQRKWLTVRVRDEYGVYRWQSSYTDTLISTQLVTTHVDGRAVAKVLPPKGGQYKVVAKGKLPTGSGPAGSYEALASTFFWMWGDEYVNWGIQNDDRINVIADKRSYSPGETARLLITAPFADSTALVSVERGGVLRYWTLPVKGTSALLDVPIHADYAPNVFVSVVLLKGQAADFPAADFKLGYVALNVELTQQKLNVELIPDRARYAPRDTAAYTVRVTNYLSRPVEAEVSLSLIDAAVLALVGDQDQDILAAFYRQRGLGVHNSLTLVTSVDRYTAYLDKKAKGGGGGGEVTTRELFADTAFWRAAVRTGPTGQTTVYVPLPDNLTTWRMRAKAVSADTRLGQGEVDVIATQDILLRPVLPRFFSVGDQAHIGAIVHNYTPVTETMNVSLQIPEAGLVGESQFLKIGPNSSAPVYWDVSVSRTLSVTVHIKALTPDGRGDAVKLTLPVNAFFDNIPYSNYQSITGTATITATLPPDVDRSLDELVIEVEPSLAASIDSGLEYLVGFPYGCVEQTMSSFLPDVVVMRLVEQVGIDVRPGFRGQLSSMIESGMQRLYGYQHNDGGWGWWKDDESNPSITAYVLYGLHQMELGGRPIDAKVRNEAAGYLLNWLQRSSVDDAIGPTHGAEHISSGANVRAYALYVLAELGQGNPGLTGRLYEQRDKLDNYGKAYLALALYITNGRKTDARVETVLQELRDAAEKQGGTVHWEDTQHDYWGMSTGVRTTAITINAFVQLFIADPTVDPAARWLLTQRQQGHWGTTQETSMSLVALVEYLTATFERDGNYSYTIRVNGQEITTQAVTPQTLGKRGKWVIPLSELGPGDPVVQVTRNAGPGGPVRANVSLRHYRSGDDIKPITSQGVRVTRSYAVAGKSLDQLSTGDIVTVTLTVKFDSSMTYVIVEDPLPAGLEPIDTSLATTSQQFQGSSQDWVWDHVELRDDRVALFATWLPGGGTRTYTYLARATTSGSFYALPLQAYAMYYPDVTGRTSGVVVKIK